MTLDWPSLWEREPGLRPRTKVGHIDCELRLSPISGEWYWHGTDYDKAPPDEGGWGHESAQVAADLCCIAAVRWILQLNPLPVAFTILDGCARVIVPAPEPDELWSAEPCSKVIAAQGDTLDAALHAACKAVIDARKCLPARSEK